MKKTQETLLYFLMSMFAPFSWYISGQVVVAIIWAIDLSFRPYCIKLIVDALQAAPTQDLFSAAIQPVVIYIGACAFIVVISSGYDILWLILHSNLKKHIGTALTARLMDHSHYFYQNYLSGNLANKINDIIVGVPKLLTTAIDQFFSDTLALIVALMTVWSVDISFACALIVWLTIFFVGSAPYFLKKAQLFSLDAAEKRAQASGAIVDILTNSMNVRLFGGKSFEEKRLETVFTTTLYAEQKRDKFFALLYFMQGFSFLVFQTICLYWLVTGIKKGKYTLGDFSLIMTLNLSVLDCVWRVSQDICDFSESLGNIGQGLRIINAPFEISDRENAAELVVKQGRITFEHVRFRYQGAAPLFKDINLIIEPGQKVGLVGYSGSGKTTFTNLLMRIMKVKSGRILIDEQDITSVTQQSLRKSISVIPQDTILFHRTLLENILYSKQDAQYDEMIEASKKAHAFEFIRKMPEGFNTMVGERGIKLSGGQRQRIAIARAFLKDAPILILDEPTSQLDSLSEKLIQESLHRLMEGKTTLVVAHRLHTLLSMDLILVFDQGRIVQRGTHQELFCQEGLYRTMWAAQKEGLLPQTQCTIR